MEVDVFKLHAAGLWATMQQTGEIREDIRPIVRRKRVETGRWSPLSIVVCMRPPCSRTWQAR